MLSLMKFIKPLQMIPTAMQDPIPNGCFMFFEAKLFHKRKLLILPFVYIPSPVRNRECVKLEIKTISLCIGLGNIWSSLL
jgi:hypothetical protein